MRECGQQTGQSTTEFMLMIPVIFAMFFFVIEMGLYFSAVHYANYATFVTARSQMAGFQNGSGTQSADEVAELVLTGSVFRGSRASGKNYTVTQEKSASGIQIALNSWVTNFPYLSALLPNMKFSTSVYLGPNEASYENRAKPLCTDNDMSSNQC